MRKLRNISIRGKLTLVTMLTSSVVLLLACAAFSIYEVIAFRKAMLLNLTTLAEIVGNNTAAALDFNDAASATETLSALDAEPDIIGACIYTKDGVVFATYDHPSDGYTFTPPALQKEGYIFAGRRLLMSRPIVHKGEMVGSVFLESDMRGLYARLARYAGIVSLVFLASLLFAFILSLRLQRLISGPILHLAQVARSVAVEKNYAVRATKRSNDELGDLIDGFNEMLGQIQQRDAALQAARAGLEARVSERTAELASSNRALQTENAERQQAEQGLRESEEKFQQLAENVSDVFWMTSPDLQQVLYVSPAYERVWGRSAAAACENPREWSDAIVPEERDRVFAAFARLMSSESSMSVEYQINLPNGELRWVHSRGFQVRDAAGKVIRLTGIASDITERKKAEQTLQRLRNQHAMILNSVGEGVHGIDFDGLIIFENPASAAMFGYEISELTGKPAHRTMHHTRADGTPYPQSECPIHATLKDGQIRHVRDEVFWRKDGTSFPVEYTTASLRDESGRITGVTVVFTDITARKQLEAQLLRSQKMETVGKLAGGIAHEFNSILTAIIGQCELLLTDLPPGTRMAKSAVEISQAAGRAATLTRQLLAYGRKQILLPETLDLNRVVSGMESVFNLLMGGDVVTQIVPAPDLQKVRVDAGQIEQVIMNMVINARDAMPNGGRLTLETANVSFDEETVGRYPELKVGNYVMLAITDTGAGISEQVKARLFEPFFTTKGVGQGTGLGLSTCYGIIKQSGGHISVYSEPGRGATFKIYLPQAEKQPIVPQERLASPALARGTETILLVEDDPALREMAGTLLTRLGYKVWPAANGIEALSLKQQRNVGHIDLLFTDVVMPHMSGKELADRVRSLYPHTRILFTTAYTENATIHQGLLDKGVALLQKPYTPSNLAHKLRELLDNSK
jgi:PAS domain S-box-containing protein